MRLRDNERYSGPEHCWEQTSLSAVTGSPYLLTDQDFPDQTIHTNFEVRKVPSAGIFALVSFC